MYNVFMDEYDRMNPEFKDLKNILDRYSKITYGREAYPLSAREAELLSQFFVRVTNTLHKNLSEWEQISPAHYKNLVAWQMTRDLLNDMEDK